MNLVNLRRAAWGRLKTQSGAFDLPSIMIGVAVVAILTVGVLAAIFGVIPWAQDRAAQQDLAAVHTAQGAVYSKNSAFTDRAGLIDADLLGKDIPASLEIRASADGLKYVGVNRSTTGTGYIITSEEPTPRELHNRDTWPDGLVIDRNAKPAPPIMITTWSTVAGQTIILPISGGVNATIDWGDGSELQEVTAENPSRTYTASDANRVITINGRFDSWGLDALPFTASSAASLLSVDRWGETGTTNLDNAFRAANNLKHVEAIPSTTKSLRWAFYLNGANFTLGKLDTKNVTDMDRMFYSATRFNQPLNFNTSSVTDMGHMFAGAERFNQDLSGWDIGKVTVRTNFNRNATAWVLPKPTF